jgi:hypothetical protein
LIIEHNVLEHRAKAKRLESIRFVLGREIVSFGAGATFDVKFDQRPVSAANRPEPESLQQIEAGCCLETACHARSAFFVLLRLIYHWGFAC